mmetsp:Transcript_22947/g.51746  ORF Transcript_22947/g.51746 Transcript_22947/m.51746 type:complete len:360 (+) Transcript_22947:58-1137(+)
MIRMKKFLLLALFGLGSDAFLIRHKIQHAVHKAEPQPAVYNTAEELAQQYTEYSALVHAALTEEKTFSTFKSQPCYMKILEHVTEEQGKMYLHFLQEDYPDLLNDMSLAKELSRNNQIGCPPILARYPSLAKTLLEEVSPTQLRYLKVLGDVRALLARSGHDERDQTSENPLDGCRIAEVGVGYGGQAQCILASCGSIAHYDLFDLPEVEDLAAKYLKETLQGGSATAWRKRPSPEKKGGGGGSYDLFISNYALSELTRALQEKYLEDLASRASSGYVTWNSNIHDSDRMTAREFANALKTLGKDVVVEAECPLTSHGNKLVTWTTPGLPCEFRRVAPRDDHATDGAGDGPAIMISEGV